MNLHAIVAPYIAAVNPMVMAQWEKSTGSVKNADFSRTPSYADPVPVLVQQQALTFKDLQQIAGLNLNGEKRALYVNGEIQGAMRVNEQGGDIFTMPDGSKWLVAQVLENWNSTAGWTKVAVVKQVA